MFRLCYITTFESLKPRIISDYVTTYLLYANNQFVVFLVYLVPCIYEKLFLVLTKTKMYGTSDCLDIYKLL